MDLDVADWLIIAGLLILLCAIYLGLGGPAALAFLGAVLLSMGGLVAWGRGNDGNKTSASK